MASRSIISIAAGRIPAAMMPDTALPASSVDGNVAKKVRVVSGLRRSFSVTSVTIPTSPSEPDERGEQVVARRVRRGAAELDDAPVREDHLRGEHVVRREPVLEAVRAARVLGHVPADRADALRGRVGRVVQARRRDGARDVEVDDARLDADPAVREIHLEDAAHPRERDDDGALDRPGAAGEAGARAARDDREAAPRARSPRPARPRRWTPAAPPARGACGRA